MIHEEISLQKQVTGREFFVPCISACPFSNTQCPLHWARGEEGKSLCEALAICSGVENQVAVRF